VPLKFRNYVPRLLVLGTCLLSASAYAQTESDPWLILPSGETGSINARTTRADLVRTYGAANVVDQNVDVGEGDMETVTIVFPNAPRRSIEIQWNPLNRPGQLTIRGNESRWKTVHGISLGTSLKQLESINGKAFHMSGYGWDYAGTVMSWDNGLLAQGLGEFDPGRGEQGRVILRLDFCRTTTSNPTTHEEDLQVAGDRDFPSSHPVLQKMNPCVGEMVWVFPESSKH